MATNMQDNFTVPNLPAGKKITASLLPLTVKKKKHAHGNEHAGHS